ncbi:MAG TPA: DUF1152 domain-containing protein [Streptosporangiaceae bacterium]|jgi:hypothetical protein|nr:DUF1152 domain-containing protein [Streptosporangiaceae bacterium]
MGRLLIAAGGGGDALAAAIIHAATTDGEPACIATFAWDRLVIDPLPGPRGQADFSGLQMFTKSTARVTGDTRPIPPAGSTLPGLAAEIDPPLILLDPADGTRGLRIQLRELVMSLGSPRAELVDVGGDVLAHGDEPELRSPLADALALAACADLGIPVDVLVVGAGLDGELTEDQVLTRAGSDIALQLSAADTDRYAYILDWHPSEATALLIAATRGARGTAEIRDGGLLVQLSDNSSNVYRIELARALAISAPARALQDASSLDEAETITRQLCGFSEIDYERAKAARADTPHQRINLRDLDHEAQIYEADAAARGIDFLTFRRLAEALGLRYSMIDQLRSHLTATRPDHYLPPLWMTSPLRNWVHDN